MPKADIRENPNLVFCQFSDNVLTPYDKTRDYYRRAYSKMPGYHMPPHFMEIPFWIPIISGLLPAYDKKLHIVTNLDTSAEVMSQAEPGTRFLFSVMDSSVAQTKQLASESGAHIVAGGYVEPGEFDNHPNVSYLGGLEGIDHHFPDWDQGAADYELFRDQKVIPRLSLSTGCLYKCTFCTVPLAVEPTTDAQVVDEVNALEPLDFELVFLDDKTFGQAPNWRQLDAIGRQIREFNPKFKGFIVQTSPRNAAQPGFMQTCAQLGVRYVEFGVEVIDDHYLKAMRKPFNLKRLEQGMHNAQVAGIPVIPNFIFGIKGADYDPTVQWVRDHIDQIPVVNGNWLAAQGNDRGGTASLRGADDEFGRNPADADQNSTEKSWLTDNERAASLDAFHEIQELTAPVIGSRAPILPSSAGGNGIQLATPFD